MLSMGSAGKPAEDALNILEIVTNPKEYRSRIEDIAKRTADLEKASGGKSKLDRADALLADAEKVKASADAAKLKAESYAKDVKSGADNYAKDTVSAADEKANAIRAAISAEQEKWAEKSKTLSDWEAAITGMKTDLERKTSVADNKAVEAERIQNVYTHKIDELKRIVNS